MSVSENKLGMSPVKAVFFTFIIGTAAMVCLIAIVYSINEKMAAILIFLAMLGWPVFGIICLFALAKGFANRRIYKAAKRAIVDGIGVTYIIKGFLTEGIVIVDEESQRIFVNDSVYPFSAVKSLNTGDGNKSIYIHMRTGSNPLKKVMVGSVQETESLYGRLVNSLGFE